MVSEDIVINALRNAAKRSKTQSALAQKAGISQSTISDYLNGRYSVGNMTLSVFFKLFPEMKIDFFGECTGDEVYDSLKSQLLEIFDALDDREKVRMVAMSAANFGEKLRGETKINE